MQKRTSKRGMARQPGAAGQAGFSNTIKETIQKLISAGTAQIEHAADSLGVSKRTLQRRLAEAGVNYSYLVDEVRLARAFTLVYDRSKKLCDIARELGYADPANFDRAFKRWTGLSPSGFRSLDRISRASLIKNLKPNPTSCGDMASSAKKQVWHSTSSPKQKVATQRESASDAAEKF